MDIRNTTLDDVAAVIGFTATLRLAAWFGDRGNLYIPDTVEEGQLLVRLIGMSAARQLTKEWGRQHINIPRLRSYEDDLRKRTIGRMLEHKMSWSEISVQMRMTERRIQQICRELEVAGLIDIVRPRPIRPPKNTRKLAKPTGALPLAFFPKKSAAKTPGKMPRKMPPKTTLKKPSRL